MNTAAIRALRRKIAADIPAFGLWITLESPSITEMAVALGVDWITIDAEHGHLDWKDIVAHLRATVRSETAGKNCGLLATSNENLQERVRQGFRLIGLGQDSGLLLRSLRGALAAVGRDKGMSASLIPPGNPAPGAPLPRPPESMQPDRSEVMTAPGAGPQVEIERGVMFECLVGGFNKARNLTTGIVTFAPSSSLPYHVHPFAESITLLRGQAAVEVEGRRYELDHLDNIVIPRETAHAARNLSNTDETVFHIAMASDAPTRTLVDWPFPSRSMPPSFAGVPGAERVNRFVSAPRGSAGPSTEFIDCFNRDLMPGIEMSGGYGMFHPGGRLPAHLHDFDESICIINGTATCVVEGSHYPLAGCATALVPRGRVHYFINESAGTMEMLWVYAGPTPERIIVDERCATEKRP